MPKKSFRFFKAQSKELPLRIRGSCFGSLLLLFLTMGARGMIFQDGFESVMNINKQDPDDDPGDTNLAYPFLAFRISLRMDITLYISDKRDVDQNYQLPFLRYSSPTGLISLRWLPKCVEIFDLPPSSPKKLTIALYILFTTFTIFSSTI